MAFRRKQYTDQALLLELNNGSLPPADFTHEAHIRLVWILRQTTSNAEQCFLEVSQIIKQYATSIGESQIFHTTLTYASVMLVINRIERNTYDTFSTFIAHNQDLLQNFKHLINKHYSDECLSTNEAKATVLQPDKAPF